MRGISERPRRPWRLVVMALVVALTMAVAACGGDDDDGGSTQAATGAATTGGESGYLAESQARMEQLYAGEDFQEPPTSSPKPQAGMNVHIVVTGLALPGSVLFADAVKDAGTTLGWRVKVYDSKFSPDRYQEGIRQAIADKADAIMVYNVDCPLAQAALQQAKEANIPVIGTESLDCNEFGDTSKAALFTDTITYTSGKFADFARGLGEAQADWIIAQTDGKANAIVFKETDLQTAVLLWEGFQERFKACTECKVARTVEFTLEDIGPKLQQKAEQALLQSPDANAVWTPYDDVITAGIGAAVKASGRNDELEVVGGAGYEANLDLVRSNGGQDGGYAVSIPWEGYAAADTVLRNLNGEKAVNSGIGVGFFDREHNLPESGSFVYPIDFAAAYKKTWEAAKAG